MSSNIVIVDYGMGNMHSVKKALKRLEVEAKISSSSNEILNAEKIILLGVGHFKKAMENLKELNLINPLNDAVLLKKIPILGICLGMQLMANKSEEGNVEGLGWIDAEIKKFNVKDTITYKIPHIGWNSINITKDSIMMKEIPENAEFYFVHSYYCSPKNRDCIVNETHYEDDFVSAFEMENIFGVQYHPEKSHDNGSILLKNFINI